MLTGGGLLCSVVAFLLGLYAGKHWPRSSGWAVALGLAMGAICFGVFFTIASWIGTLWPARVDAYVLGLHLIIFVVAAPVCGALGALLAYRRSVNQRIL